jgi:putative OPT family oligopeptide transporter
MGRGQAAAGAVAAISIGSVVCCAAAIAGDNMQDLKAGVIVGATPWKQQVMQMVGTVSAALVMAPILTLLLKAYGFAGHTSAKGNPLVAVQASLMASVARGVFEGKLPWIFVYIGMGMGAAVIAGDLWLQRRGSEFRMPVLAVAIGFYLPLSLSVPIFAGGMISWLIGRGQVKRMFTGVAVKAGEQRGLLLASGLITGEALVGILMAIPIVLSKDKDILRLIEEPVGARPGIVLLAAIGYWLYRTGLGTKSEPAN